MFNALFALLRLFLVVFYGLILFGLAMGSCSTEGRSAAGLSGRLQ